MHRCSFLIIMFVLVSSVGNFALSRQDYAFKVLAFDGTVSYKDHTSQEWLPVDVGTSLSSEALIKVEKGGYLGLVHASGQTYNIEKSGTYEIDRIARKFNSEETGVVTKYADAFIEKAKANGASATPVAEEVERSSAPQQSLKLLLPSSVDVFGPEVILRWSDQEILDQEYEVVLKNMFDEVLMVKDAQGTRCTLDFSERDIAQERLLIVSVHRKNQKGVQSKDYGIKQMTSEEAELIESDLKELKLAFSNSENALDKLILASFYEQNNLLADALTHYEYAVDLAEDKKAFKKVYDQFIFRNGLGF